MLLLLDTHAALWLDSGAPRGEAALTAIGEVAAGPGVLLSPVGAWEIGFLVAKGRIALDLPAPVWIARHEAASRNPDSKQDFVPVYICHGWDKQWARQAFHNLNTLGVRPNAALSIGMDARDPITRICRTVERGVPLFKDRVNKVRRQLRTGDAHIVTITTLRGACVTLAKGISGVQYGARPVPIADDELKQVEEAALDWFHAVAGAIGPSLEDHETKLASSPAVLAAIGALGHQLVAENDSDLRRDRAATLAGALKNIDWARGSRWDGVAGKVGPKGTFAVGGAKEYAYAVYSALTDPVSSGYSSIRPATARAA